MYLSLLHDSRNVEVKISYLLQKFITRVCNTITIYVIKSNYNALVNLYRVRLYLNDSRAFEICIFHAA